MGAASAYFLKRSAPSLSVLLIERDPTYEFSSTTRSAASIRHQFSTPECIQMSRFGTEFLRDVDKHLRVRGGAGAAGGVKIAKASGTGPGGAAAAAAASGMSGNNTNSNNSGSRTNEDAVDVGFREQGYLFFASNAAGVEIMKQNHKTQCENGADVALLSPKKILERFPFFNLNGTPPATASSSAQQDDDAPSYPPVLLGSLGLSGEGWFDAHLLLNAFVNKVSLV